MPDRTLTVLFYVIVRSDHAVVDEVNECPYLITTDSISAEQHIHNLPRLYHGIRYQVYAVEQEIVLDDLVFESN
jgi:hypothetical protein